MVNQQIVSWIKQQKERGFSEEQIKDHLIKQGHNINEIDESISRLGAAASFSSLKLFLYIFVGVIAAGLIAGGAWYFLNEGDDSLNPNNEEIITENSDNVDNEKPIANEILNDNKITDKGPLTLNYDGIYSLEGKYFFLLGDDVDIDKPERYEQQRTISDSMQGLYDGSFVASPIGFKNHNIEESMKRHDFRDYDLIPKYDGISLELCETAIMEREIEEWDRKIISLIAKCVDSDDTIFLMVQANDIEKTKEILKEIHGAITS